MGPIQTASHNDGQQLRLKQAMNATISRYMTCTGATWTHVGTSVTTAVGTCWTLPYAHHDCLLGFHIHSLFGLLHLKKSHNKPSTWIWYTKAIIWTTAMTRWKLISVTFSKCLTLWQELIPDEKGAYPGKHFHPGGGYPAGKRAVSCKHKEMEPVYWRHTVLYVMPQVWNKLSMWQAAIFLHSKGKEYYHAGNSVLNKKCYK
jgi:hypothetical protein